MRATSGHRPDFRLANAARPSVREGPAGAPMSAPPPVRLAHCGPVSTGGAGGAGGAGPAGGQGAARAGRPAAFPAHGHPRPGALGFCGYGASSNVAAGLPPTSLSCLWRKLWPFALTFFPISGAHCYVPPESPTETAR